MSEKARRFCSLPEWRTSIIDAVTPGNAGSTLTVAMYMYAKERGDMDTAFAIAAILLIITFIINIAAHLAAKLLKKETRK